MNKLFAVMKREYITAIRKKLFIIMTFLLPLLGGGFMYLIVALAQNGLGVKNIVVVDGTGALQDTFNGASVTQKTRVGRRDVPSSLHTQYVDAKNQNVDDVAQTYVTKLSTRSKESQLDGVLVIPAGVLATSDKPLKYYSRSATDIMAESSLSQMTNQAVQRKRLVARGVADADVDAIMKSLHIDAVQVTKTGEQKKGGGENFIIGFVMTFLLFFPSLMYGLEIMRGIIAEKTDRVAEVLVSSMSATQLLTGKIIGVAAVGLTQILVWCIMAALVGTGGAAVATFAGSNVMQFIRPSTFVYFGIFFILAYLSYVCVYAIGGAVCNTEKEAQQMIAPITMVMMAPWFLLSIILTNPESNLAVGFSLAPLFGPLTMYMRTLVGQPPMWHIVLSIVVSLATIAALFWITAKIFRVGILSYGKRPTIPELWRWVKVA